MDLFVDLKVPAVGGSQWTTADRQREEKSLCGNDLQTLLDFCGSPQIDTVERALGISLVVEGVESDEQRVRLIELGCSIAQGYLFARPMPEQHFLDYCSGS